MPVVVDELLEEDWPEVSFEAAVGLDEEAAGGGDKLSAAFGPASSLFLLG